MAVLYSDDENAACAGETAATAPIATINRKRGKTSGDRGGAARVRAFSGRLTNRLSRRRFCAGQPAAQRVLTRAGRLGTSIALGTLSLAPR